MICLGIESTAHTFGVGIVKYSGKFSKITKKDVEILANVRDMYTTEQGGIHPTEAKKHHQDCADRVIKQALQEAKLNEKDIDLISFSQGPGLPPCLVVGMEHAKKLATKLDKPLIGVNHCIAHLEIGKVLTKATDPVLLYCSGANTQIIAYDGGKYRIFGETLDNGIGNFLDGFARHLDLGFPGGPKLEQLALKRKKSNEFVQLPYVVKGMDVSFGGIQTNLKQKYDSGKYSKEDLAYACQETVFSMLLEVSERAMAHCQKKELVLGGGVACNARLQEMSTIMCLERKAQMFCPPKPVLVDNGVMIAWQGMLEQKNAVKPTSKLFKNIDILPRWRTDQVIVDW